MGVGFELQCLLRKLRLATLPKASELAFDAIETS